MRDIWRQTGIMAGIGFALGLFVGLGFLTAMGGLSEYCAQYGAQRLALYLGLSALLGAVNMGTATVYSLERWGILRCTLTHFAIAMTSVCAAGFSLGWLSLDSPATLWTLAGCVVAYFIVWLVMYALYKRRIRRINEALKRWKGAREED